MRTGWFAARRSAGRGRLDVDLPFLALAGRSAAPANAAAEVKRIVSYVSPRDTSDGVRDILKHFGLPV